MQRSKRACCYSTHLNYAHRARVKQHLLPASAVTEKPKHRPALILHVIPACAALLQSSCLIGRSSWHSNQFALETSRQHWHLQAAAAGFMQQGSIQALLSKVRSGFLEGVRRREAYCLKDPGMIAFASVTSGPHEVVLAEAAKFAMHRCRKPLK